MERAGKFLVIEGTDGSGKAEQTQRVVTRLAAMGVRVAMFDFPRYDQESSWFIREYLNGNFGTLDQINPMTASLFFALDRYAAARDIVECLAEGMVVISNRYAASNLAHQGSKFNDLKQRHAYFQWCHDLEYNVNKIPKPDCNIVLLVPPETAQALVDHKAAREHLGGKKRDLHEADIEYLRKTHDVYRELVQLFPEYFVAVDCVREGRLLSIEEIHEIIWDQVGRALALSWGVYFFYSAAAHSVRRSFFFCAFQKTRPLVFIKIRRIVSTRKELNLQPLPAGRQGLLMRAFHANEATAYKIVRESLERER